MSDGGIRVEYVALDDVLRWPRNPKTHDVGALSASVRRFGFTAPLLYDEGTGRMVAGHGRLETLQAMRQLGEPAPGRIEVRDGAVWYVPVLRGVSFASESEAEAYLVADNRLVEVGGWDEHMLADVMRDQMRPGMPTTEAMGFTAEEVSALLGGVAGSANILGGAVAQAKSEIEVDDPSAGGDEDGVEDFSRGRLRAPFPYFGGKYAVAPYVWRRFGRVKQYVEPFCGSAAVLLANPDPANLEVIGDANCYVANFWRALKFGAGELWKWADYLVSHVDQMARHRWLTEPERVRSLRASLLADPEWPGDPQVAGWWVWGQCSWIGSGWCEKSDPGGDPLPQVSRRAMGLDAAAPALEQIPFLGHQGRGLQSAGTNGTGQVPHLSSAGQGLQVVSEKKPHVQNAGRRAQRPGQDPEAWLTTLANRLARVRVICGSWDRCLNHHYGADDTAVFLDPPYRGYEAPYGDMACDLGALATWCRENQHLKVALCGHAGDYDLPGWHEVAWSRRRKTYGGDGTTDLEAIWFSPVCLPHSPA